jgi:DNA modification methylase
MQIEMRKVSELIPYENNPRINDQAVDAVAASIKEFGFKVPVIVDRDDVVIAGHTRIKAARQLGMETVPTIKADDLTPEQVKAFRLADNMTAEKSKWDFERLYQELEELQKVDLDFDMADFGFELDMLDDYTEIKEDEVETEIEEVISESGDTWLLGDHILYVGDSTNSRDMTKLVGDEEIDLVVTDPPYGVSYEGRSQELDHKTIESDNLQFEEFYTFLVSAFQNIKDVLKPGGAFYIWYGGRALNFYRAMHEVKLDIRQQLVWNKNSFILGRQDYQWKHEVCMYGWKEGAEHYFTDSRREATVIDCHKPLKNDLHPTMKPVKLIAYQIKNSSKRGESVLDPFGGSGTTMIACEQLGRRCFMMEFDPYFADVIVNRWEKFTGKEAERIRA